MFASLTDKLGQVLRRLRGVSHLSEENMQEALKEVRTALLSADVHFRVAREFIERVQAQAVGREVLKSITPGQQIVKILHDELVRLLGEGSPDLAQKRPLGILMVGLHGSGKTTTSAKLGRLLARKGYRPLLAACDVYRPAAIDQLEILAKQENLGFFADRTSKDVPAIARAARAAATAGGFDCAIYDTAGRLQIDDALVAEVAEVRRAVSPDEVLLVADAALGQEAVNVARVFHDRVVLTGIVMTKLDGDARGGAALSMKSVTGVPIKFAGTGEKISDLEPFHPDRMASRILGMGDVVSLVERAQETLDQDEQKRLAERMRRGEFDLEDFLAQIRQIRRMGPMEGILKMLPGMGGVELGGEAEGQLRRTEAIILSMTRQERRRPEIINGSRRGRIARGSGTSPSEVNALLKQYGMMRKMMKAMKGKDPRKLLRDLRSQPGVHR